jgi:hypothetical protein
MLNKKNFTKNEAAQIGSVLKIKWNNFDIEQFRRGLDVELEHGKISPETNITNNNPNMTGKIALAHLNEFPDYYTRLEKLEKQADKFWKKKRLNNLRNTKIE